MRCFAAIVFVLGLLGGVQGALADKVTTERVKFAQGTSAAAIQGAVKGYDSMHYMVGAKAGQSMQVSLETSSKSAYFNVFAPGDVPGQSEAMFIGDTGGYKFDGSLPENGDYLIQVYIYRSAARRNEGAKFTLNVGISGSASDATGQSGDALVAGTEFNATGEVPCARSAGQPMGSCKFGVVREGNGNGSITVFWPDGGNRVIFFEDNTPMRYDESEADGGAKMTVNQNADLFTVTIGDQRFEIPDAAISGG